MERLKNIKDTLIGQVQGQMGNLHKTNAKELGEVVDMIKDIEEAIYYCTITKSMEEKKNKEDSSTLYYTENYYHDRDMERPYGKMYYTDFMSTPSNIKNYPIYYRDYREGQSPLSRKMYMESKEMHQDKAVQMQELEKYISELTTDIMDMIKGASPEEKKVLQTKISTLATKIQ